jgi:hypothetical protein
VPVRRVLGVLEEIEIRYQGQFFTGDHMLLSQPSLWIFDCRRCSSVGKDAEWSVEDYSKSLSIVQQWMDQIPWWNIIFLLPEGNFFDDALQDSIGLPLGTIARTGMWVFDPTIYRHTVDDIKYGNNIIRIVEPLGGIGFVFYCPEGEDPTMNFREGGKSCHVYSWRNGEKIVSLTKQTNWSVLPSC